MATSGLFCLKLLAATCAMEITLGSRTWLARIPSESKMSDGPSRLGFSILKLFPGGRRVEPRWPMLIEVWPRGSQLACVLPRRVVRRGEIGRRRSYLGTRGRCQCACHGFLGGKGCHMKLPYSAVTAATLASGKTIGCVTLKFDWFCW